MEKMEEDSKGKSIEQIEDEEFVMHIEELKIDDQLQILKPAKKTLTIDDYETVTFLGEGAYAKVIQAREKATGKTYAIKMIIKKFIKKVWRTLIIIVVKERISSKN